MQDGLNSLPLQNAAGTHVTTAVVPAVVVKKKAGREKMLFCCKSRLKVSPLLPSLLSLLHAMLTRWLIRELGTRAAVGLI